MFLWKLAANSNLKTFSVSITFQERVMLWIGNIWQKKPILGPKFFVSPLHSIHSKMCYCSNPCNSTSSHTISFWCRNQMWISSWECQFQERPELRHSCEWYKDLLQDLLVELLLHRHHLWQGIHNTIHQIYLHNLCQCHICYGVLKQRILDRKWL